MKYRLEVNDIVKLKDGFYNTYAKDILWNENAFCILSISNDGVTISDIDGVIPWAAIEPIPIDTVADACIYYDPMIAADIIMGNKTCPCHHRDTSYYVDGFAQMHLGDRTLKDEFLEKKFCYIHEVQHWLREDSDWEELKINQTIKSAEKAIKK